MFDDEIEKVTRRKKGMRSAIAITILGALLLVGIFFYLAMSTI